MRHPRNASIRRAFTLTELTVVIAIIVMLAALTLAVLPAVMGQSDERRINSVLTVLDTALQEWEKNAERKLRWSRAGESVPYNVEIEEPVSATAADAQDQFADSDPLEPALLPIIRRQPEVQAILAGIDEEFLRRFDGGDETSPPTIFDPWDIRIAVIHPGRTPQPDVYSADSGAVIDEDGTVRTQIENILGYCLNRQVCFVSAGPDGKFGDLHLDVAAGSLSPAEEADVEAAADNIYSYPIGKERP